MIISRTPFRISFFGGGTDYPSWYLKNGGQVLGAAINKYCYISCRYLPPFFEHRYRVVYSKLENCASIEDIQHPAVREVLKMLDVKKGMEIHHDGDIPARSGIGSSSSFAVGILHATNALLGRLNSKAELASQAIKVEQELLGETVGSQDQVFAAHGGFNHIEFERSGNIIVNPVTLPRARIDELGDCLMLFFTGISRSASAIANSYVENLAAKESQLRKMGAMVDEGISILSGSRDIGEFGELLHQAWLAKRSIGDKISTPHIDELYERARSAGAIGGKLLGAGGGGFLLLFVKPEMQAAVQGELKDLLHIPFEFEYSGSRIIFFEPS